MNLFYFGNFSIGMQLKPAVIREKGLRPLVISSTSGKIQTTMVSYSDVA